MASSRVWELVWKKDVYMATNAMFHMLRQKETPAKSQREVVRKDQLRYWRSLYNWIVYLKILIRESPFYVNKENWDQSTPSNSPRAPGIKSNFGKERFIAKYYPSVRLISAVLARQYSGKDHMRKPCTKKDAPAKQRGIWRTYLQAQEFRQNYVLYSHWSKSNAGIYFKKTRGARIRSWFRSINAHDVQKRIEIGKREILTSLFMRSIKNLNLNDFSYTKQVDGRIRLRETKISLHGELELRNGLFQEDHAREYQ